MNGSSPCAQRWRCFLTLTWGIGTKKVLDGAQKVAAEARERGLFEPAPDVETLRLVEHTALAKGEREASRLCADLDKAKAVLRELDDFISQECSVLHATAFAKRADLHRRVQVLITGLGDAV